MRFDAIPQDHHGQPRLGTERLVIGTSPDGADSLFAEYGKLLYTAITRGKQLVVIVGQRKALALAVREREADRRITRLRENLKTP